MPVKFIKRAAFKGALISMTLSFTLSLAAPAFAVSAREKSARNALKEARKGPLKIVMDGSHAEIFSILKEGPINYSQFHELLKKSGMEVEMNRDPITPKALERVGTYIIAGPAGNFEANEVKLLKEFVKNGGNLLILIHISPPVAPLTAEFGIIVSNFVICDSKDNIEGRTQDFFVSSFSPHAVTAGLKKIAVYGTWGLMGEGSASIVAATSAKAWADLNRNRKFDKDEPRQAFGIVAVTKFGKGKVAVVADDAPFANQFLESGDNMRLAENILRWFRE